jgi:hypothetical protein
MSEVSDKSTRSYDRIGRTCNILAVIGGVLAVASAKTYAEILPVILAVVGFRRDRPVGRWVLVFVLVAAVVGTFRYYQVHDHLPIWRQD